MPRYEIMAKLWKISGKLLVNVDFDAKSDIKQ